MKLKQLIQKYSRSFSQRYGNRLLPSHRKALDAILACRSQCGEFYVRCEGCDRRGVFPLSCGHRSCPQCQHHLCESWQQRQQSKLLPVNYLMVTFTIPKELRDTTWRHQSILYDILFKAGIEALQTVGKNNYGVSFGATAILHTHKRDKGFHPHIHVVMPCGGIPLKDSSRQWKSLAHNFLINELALARIFRGIFLRQMFEQAIELPKGLPAQWVSHIKNVGRGQKAFKYLARYLYRGVISEDDIVSDEGGNVTFRYQESKTRKMKTKVQPAETFIWSLLKHVLPRGFRRVRDHGFLHGNAKKTLTKIQQLLGQPQAPDDIQKRTLTCPECQSDMCIELIIPRRIPMKFHFYTKNPDNPAWTVTQG